MDTIISSHTNNINSINDNFNIKNIPTGIKVFVTRVGKIVQINIDGEISCSDDHIIISGLPKPPHYIWFKTASDDLFCVQGDGTLVSTVIIDKWVNVHVTYITID